LGLTNPYATLSTGQYGAYGTGYGESDFSGLMRGSADVLTSQGKWMVSLQQASLTKEQDWQAKIQTNRKAFDQYLYERAHTPTFEEERQRVAQDDLKRSSNDPPVSEIWTGQALNIVLKDLLQRQQENGDAPAISLDPDLLRHINLTTSRGNPALLKNEGRLSWPPSLLDDTYKTERALLNSLAPEAIHQAINGRVDTGTLKAMSSAVQRLRRQLNDNVKELTASQYIDANRFLVNLEDGFKVLGRTDAGAHFTGTYSAPVRTVAELVKHMATQGLHFAPAVAGDGASYVALHRALLAYGAGLKAVASAER
jgi:hypothetical protein